MVFPRALAAPSAPLGWTRNRCFRTLNSGGVSNRAKSWKDLAIKLGAKLGKSQFEVEQELEADATKTTKRTVKVAI